MKTTTILVWAAALASMGTSCLHGQAVKGRFVAYVITKDQSSDPPVIVTERNATIQLPFTNNNFSKYQLDAATLEMTAPAETPVGTDFGPEVGEIAFYHTSHEYFTMSATLSTTI